MKKSNFSIIYFLLIFLFLYYSFYVYVGLSTPGGKYFSPFLYKYLDIPTWLSIIAAKATKILLEIGGYSTYQKSSVNVTIEGSRGVTIAWGCIGVGAMVAWLAFVFAHKEKVTYKLKWFFSGVIIIYIINTFRIATIALSNYYNWHYIHKLNAHTIFNIITYIVIIILMALFVYYYNRRAKHE